MIGVGTPHNIGVGTPHTIGVGTLHKIGLGTPHNIVLTKHDPQVADLDIGKSAFESQR